MNPKLLMEGQTMIRLIAFCALFLSALPRAYGADAILAGGCFWCIEKDFEQVAGVIDVKSGYTGGTNENPTYENHTQYGHREVVKIVFDEQKISYENLLRIFWRTVDPTDAKGQFCDRGPAYTTAIYALDDSQFEQARESKKQAAKDLGKAIATPIEKAGKFTPSEEYHQDYAKKNPVRYAFYRGTCGRDKAVKKLWGEQAYRGVQGKH